MRSSLSFVSIILLFISIQSFIAAHSHSHEAPHLKYTREVNEQAAQEEDHGHVHSHGHSHAGGKCPHAHSHGEDEADHGHAHGHFDEAHQHSHEPHGHSHEDAGHVHSHGHTHEEPHVHSHGDGGHGHSHGGAAEQRTKREASMPLDSHKFEGALSFLNCPHTRLWVYAVGATLLISIAPFFILLFIPIQANTADSGPFLKVLLAFGSGGLLGDAFLHLIPHAQPADGGHSHSHSHDAGHSHGPHDMSVGGGVLAGIIAFLFIEKLLRILRGGGHGHSHSGGHSPSIEKKEKKGGKSEKSKKAKSSDDEEEEEKEQHDHQHEHEGIKIAAYLNLAADFAHNFTDGLAIGASFIAGSTIGVVTMVTVLVHEIPHEIGDFAILVQSGYTKKKAMLIQLVTAFGALSGCVLALWSADVNGNLADAAAHSWVLPFTAGGFIYIATVSVIPELLENSSLWQTVKEIIALLLGIWMMYLIAMYE